MTSIANHATLATVYSAWGFVEKQLNKLAPVADLIARMYIAKIFFTSGLNKFQDWDTTLYLFREEYHVPLLPPDLAAILGTGGELCFSVLLTLGLFTRFSACALFALNIVAVASYYAVLKGSPVAIQDHLEWGILLFVLLSSTTRTLTLDHFVMRNFGLRHLDKAILVKHT